ncbi:MAG: bifunctional hydroxymethylpyrimidine kinase/phosphomethylpyrimidine kinase [Planctomycetota bacterium]
MSDDTLPRVLLVGGVDSSGHSGLDADRAAARAFECEATAVSTAATDQDLFQVRSVEERLLWHREAADALPGASAVKFGLLPGVASIVEAARIVARSRHGAPEVPAVVDPVIASSSGYRFWTEREFAWVRDSLLVSGPILTPNLDELAELAWEDRGSLVGDAERTVRAAERLLEAGVSAVVAKGGHGDPDGPVRDLVLVPGAAPHWIERDRVPGDGIRGSGCRFATALSCALARGRALPEAAEAAGAYVASCIRDGGEEDQSPG